MVSRGKGKRKGNDVVPVDLFFWSGIRIGLEEEERHGASERKRERLEIYYLF